MTEVKEKTALETELPPTAEMKAGQELVAVANKLPLRLPYPRNALDLFGVDPFMWKAIIDVVYPLARSVESIMLAMSYCKARNLDIMKRVVHIVPMWSRAANDGRGGLVDTLWPGIAEVRITAARTLNYAGKDSEIEGPMMTAAFEHGKERVELEFPEWCQVTVYKMIQGVRCAFVGPKVYWLEAYGTEAHDSEIPNDMWRTRTRGQLAKCAEAAALRAAFPEELGNEYVAEEMEGKIIEGVAVRVGEILKERVVNPDGTMNPPKQTGTGFERQETPARAEPESRQTDAPAAAGAAESGSAGTTGPGGREAAPSPSESPREEPKPAEKPAADQAALPLQPAAELTPEQRREQEWQDYRQDLHRQIVSLQTGMDVDLFEDRHLPEFDGRPAEERQQFKEACARRFNEIRSQRKSR